MTNYASNYSDDGFWAKMSQVAKSVGRKVLQPALELYLAMGDSRTPTWAKSVAVGALGYLIMPLDLSPDFLPFVGLSDDILTMSAAISSLGRYVTPELKDKARRTAEELIE